MAKVTIFFDGKCPLCLREIALLRRWDRKQRLAFEDVADPDASPNCDIAREDLLARFHAQLPSGEMVSGARAFTEAYACLPGFQFVGGLGRFVVSRWILEVLYAFFLKIRPSLQWLAKRLTA